MTETCNAHFVASHSHFWLKQLFQNMQYTNSTDHDDHLYNFMAFQFVYDSKYNAGTRTMSNNLPTLQQQSLIFVAQHKLQLWNNP